MSTAPAAAAPDPQLPAPMATLLACRSLPDGTERLTCFNAASSVLATAIADHDLVVTNREQRKAIEKADFGRPGTATVVDKRADRNAPPPPARIDAVIARVSRSANGRWLIVLDNGARWQQADDRMLARDPRASMPITITRAALGSYLGKVDGQTAIRLRRVD